MASDTALVAEAARLGASAAAAFAGLAAAAVLRSLFRRGDGGAARRSVAAMTAASVAVAAGAWSFVTAARGGVSLDFVAAYLAAGFAAGLLVGLFPRAVGLPLLTAAVLTTAAAVVGLSPWLPWSPGAEAARVTAYRADGDATMIALRTAAAHGRSSERNLELGPGPIRLEFDVVDIRGPLSLAFGPRRYRPVALSTTTAIVALNGDRGPLIAPGDGGLLAKALGCTVATLTAPPFEPFAMATASYTIKGDGAIEMVVE